ncbi:type VI secretion system baseplate subunit TssG [Luteimonas abyssi]|uniref:type VI secretion system baseplate subunit TssG n=1 Tax=Luteimonas abyssi TaxID=1247514 RepID=UPI000737BDCB|nr:type VI secretion system baseplate subunit TssG [Luteimonas abyssi]
MARKARQSTDPVALLQALQAHPHAFEMFQALRLIDCAYPDKPRLGRAPRPQDEAMRLAQRATLTSPPRSVDGLVPAPAGGLPQLKTFPLGLFGPQGALPLHLTEYAIQREELESDPTFAAFVDMFHHRMIALWYRAWADSRPAIHMDRPDEDRFGQHLDALTGVGQPALRDRGALPAYARRHYAGRFVAQARSAEGLRAVLGALFDVPIQVMTFFAGWLRMPSDGCLRMGRAAARLGSETTLGECVRNAQHRFRLQIGPMGAADYRHFLPGGAALKELVAAVRQFLGDEFAWDVQLILKREDVPAPRLGVSQRMGQSIWMGRYARQEDADDLVLTPSL